MNQIQNDNTDGLSVILLAAGESRRIGGSVPKQFMLLKGRPVILHSLEKISRLPNVKEIIIGCREEYRETIIDIASEHLEEEFVRKFIFCDGGDTRQESVLKAVKSCTQDTILLHEAARPLAPMELFLDVLNAQSEAVTPGMEIPFTVLEKEKVMDSYRINAILDRTNLFDVQLPQKFNRHKLLDAHVKAKSRNQIFTDDSSLYFSEGYEVQVIPGSSQNIKITHARDLLIAEQLLEK